MFDKEYDINSLQKIHPAGQIFEMYVTPRYVEHYTKNIYEALTTRIIAKYVPENAIFVDVGAHYGYYSMIAGAENKAQRIISFEPSPLTFEVLKRNAELNKLENIELYNLAVSDIDGERPLMIAEASDSSGFYEHAQARTIEQINVKTAALDTILGDTGDAEIFVKIDAEGHEISILEGMRGLLSRSLDRIKLVIEFNPKMLVRAGREPGELITRLFDYGFQVYSIDEKSGIVKSIESGQLGNSYVELKEVEQSNGTINLYCVPAAQSLNVVFFSHSAEIAGAEKSLVSMVEHLSQKGVLCTVVLPVDGKLRSLLENAGAFTIIAARPYAWWATVNRITPEEKRSHLTDGFDTIASDVLPKLKQINPDVIVSNTTVIPWGSVAAFLLNKPHIWYIREFGDADHGLIFYYPNQLIAKYMEGSSNSLISVSRATQEYFFGKSLGENSHILPSIITRAATHGASPDDRRFFFQEDSIKLVLLGRISAGKGQLDAVQAVHELTKAGQKVELVFAGISEEEYAAAIRKFIKQHNLQSSIHIHGFVNNPTPLYQQADIILVCSRIEAFGLVTVEGMLLGKPVIATNSGGTPEFVEDNVTGLLYSPGDYRELAKKIKQLIEDPELGNRLGRQAAQFAQESFPHEASTAKLLEILRSQKQAQNVSSREFINWVVDLIEQHNIAVETTYDQEVQALRSQIAAQVTDADALQARLEEQVQITENVRFVTDRLEQELKDHREYITQREEILQNLNTTLLDIYSSSAWKIIRWMWRIRLWLAPKDSWREKFGRKLFNPREWKTAAADQNKDDLTTLRVNKPLDQQKWVVMATAHTLFIAHQIAERLRHHGCQVSITTTEPSDFASDFYVVICPQMFKTLPPGEKRIAFQMEQSISSRWFTLDYLKILTESMAVLDYSLSNVEFLENKGIKYPHVYYLPIGASNTYAKQIIQPEKEYDILFYGDHLSSPRRLRMLEALEKEFNVKLVSEVYGSELLATIRKAKFVINIHYYENALLETPRIQECLSLGVPVISEAAQDQHEYPEFGGAVRFFKEDSIPEMLKAVREALECDDLSTDISGSVQRSEQRFGFMFDRFLIGAGFLSASFIDRIPLPAITEQMVLSMPETVVRRRTFEQLGVRDFSLFDGLRKSPGWMGCALSYVALARNALSKGIKRLTVMEDDVLLPENFETVYAIVHEYLDMREGEWDIFAGVIASLHPETKILGEEIYKDLRFVTIDKMTSTVFNIYSERALHILTGWDPDNMDPETNTIDRYVEKQSSLRVVVLVPYLVGHREDLNSTIWGFQNSQYHSWISASQIELEAKLLSYYSGDTISASTQAEPPQEIVKGKS